MLLGERIPILESFFITPSPGASASLLYDKLFQKLP